MSTREIVAEIARQYPNVTTGDQAFGCATCTRLYMAWANAAPRIHADIDPATSAASVDMQSWRESIQCQSARQDYRNHARTCKARHAWQLKIERELREMEMK